MANVTSRSSFSDNGLYFGLCNIEGKLKVWETTTGTLIQEYIPNLHLSTPFTCMTWINLSRASSSEKRHRKRKSLEGGGNDHVIALGTVKGKIQLYSVSHGAVISSLEKGHQTEINDLSWRRGSDLFSCGNDKYIMQWDVSNGSLKEKWKAGSERLTCVVVLPDGETLLSASRTICWWNIREKQIIKTFTGQANFIQSLVFVPCHNGDNIGYCLSASTAERYISCWALNRTIDNNGAVVSLLLEDCARNVSVFYSPDNDVTTMVAITTSGVLHIFQHQLNGPCSRPLKPKVTVQVATETEHPKETVISIPIMGFKIFDPSSILIAHGNMLFFTFEKIVPNYEEPLMCLVRKDPKKMQSKRKVPAKVKTPETGEFVNYAVPTGLPINLKRSLKSKESVSMQEKLENLSLMQPEKVGIAKHDTVANLILQGLRSKDKRLLFHALLRNDIELISNTVKRLPMNSIVPLVKELCGMLAEKVHSSSCAANWLKCILTTHAGILMSNPDALDALSPVIGIIESRLTLLAPLLKLRGRLEVIAEQIKTKKAEKFPQPVEDSCPVFYDGELSDDGMNVEDENDKEQWDGTTTDDDQPMQDASSDSEVQIEEMSD